MATNGSHTSGSDDVIWQCKYCEKQIVNLRTATPNCHFCLKPVEAGCNSCGEKRCKCSEIESARAANDVEKQTQEGAMVGQSGVEPGQSAEPDQCETEPTGENTKLHPDKPDQVGAEFSPDEAKSEVAAEAKSEVAAKAKHDQGTENPEQKPNADLNRSPKSVRECSLNGAKQECPEARDRPAQTEEEHGQSLDKAKFSPNDDQELSPKETSFDNIEAHPEAKPNENGSAASAQGGSEEECHLNTTEEGSREGSSEVSQPGAQPEVGI